MVADAIGRIREAEQKADERERRARAERKKIIADAHEQSELLIEETRRAARDAEREAVETARAEAEREAERLAAEGKGQVEEVRAAAEKKIGSGVERVLTAITATT